MRDPREDLESRSPNLGPYTGYFFGTPIKGSTFWILPGVWETINAKPSSLGAEGDEDPKTPKEPDPSKHPFPTHTRLHHLLEPLS